jgi:hypothetical protein
MSRAGREFLRTAARTLVLFTVSILAVLLIAGPPPGASN